MKPRHHWSITFPETRWTHMLRLFAGSRGIGLYSEQYYPTHGVTIMVGFFGEKRWELHWLENLFAVDQPHSCSR